MDAGICHITATQAEVPACIRNMDAWMDILLVLQVISGEMTNNSPLGQSVHVENVCCVMLLTYSHETMEICHLKS